MKRYERLAADMAAAIGAGAWKPGDRLPSVRETSSSRRISPSTVFEAYYLLEARGLVEARQRSGYFVRDMSLQAHSEPQTSAPNAATQDVRITDLVFDLLKHVRQRDVVPLGSAFPSPLLFPLDNIGRHVAKVVKNLDPWKTVEDLTPGSESLRRFLGRRYLTHGASVDASEIVITNGAMEALNLCLESVARPGDLIAIESPTFYAALQAVERLGLRVVEVATHPRTGVDLSSLADVLSRHDVKACWFMPNFQNPLGSVVPDSQKQELVDLLAQRDVPLIEDDVYSEVYFGNRRPLPAKAFDKKGLVMHCSSFSKSLAPGYRVGWVAAGRFVETISKRKLSTSLAVAVPAQEGLCEYLAHGGFDRHLRQLRKTLAQGQAEMIRAIADYFPEDVRVTRPEGGYFLWIEMPPAVDALTVHRLALSQGIGVAPGHIFSADRRFTNCLRLNYGHAGGGRVAEAVRILGHIVRSLS